MKTRPLVIQVPEPDEDGLCSTTCELLPCCPYAKEIDFNETEVMVIALKPGPGCPWTKEDKE